MPSPELSPSKPPPSVRPSARTETKINHRRAQRRVASTPVPYFQVQNAVWPRFPRPRPSIATPGIRDGDTQIRTVDFDIDCRLRATFVRQSQGPPRVPAILLNPDYRDVPRALSRSLAHVRWRAVPNSRAMVNLGPGFFFRLPYYASLESLPISLSLRGYRYLPPSPSSLRSELSAGRFAFRL